MSAVDTDHDPPAEPQVDGESAVPRQIMLSSAPFQSALESGGRA